MQRKCKRCEKHIDAKSHKNKKYCTRQCSRLTEYYRNKPRYKERFSIYYRNNSHELIENNRLYRKNNKQKIKKRKAKYYLKNKDDILAHLSSEQGKLNMKRYNHSEKGKLRTKKYKKTNTFKAKRLRESENRRKKFGKCKNYVSSWLVKIVNDRDDVCVYCHKDFVNDRESGQYPTFDHVNSSVPFIEINTVKACNLCNSKKGEKNVLEWCKAEGLNPAPIVKQLVNLSCFNPRS